MKKIKLKGVTEAIKKHQSNNVEPKGIKAHFNLDESGILSMSVVEYHVEKTLTPEEVAAQQGDEQSTFSKLSNTISKLFQGKFYNFKRAGWEKETGKVMVVLRNGLKRHRSFSFSPKLGELKKKSSVKFSVNLNEIFFIISSNSP